MMKQMRKTCRFCSALAVSALIILMAPVSSAWADESSAVRIEYENLGALVLQNQALQEEIETDTTNRENYESLLAALNDERDYMRLLAEQYKDVDGDAENNYKNNASAIASSISRVYSQLERLNSKSSQNARQDIIDSYTMTAQNLMNTYNQMLVNAAAKEKSAQAAEKVWQSMVKKQSTGVATAAQVLEAESDLKQQQNLSSSYQQQASQARFHLLSALGIDTETEVVIGTVPEPDLSAIAAISLEADLEKAVGNSKSVQSVRHSGAGTYAEIDRKFKSEAEAEGAVRASVQDSYRQLQADVLNYSAASDAFESASIVWRSMQLKKQSGMVNEADYLEGEAEYLEAAASKETASMALYQTSEGYLWEVAGIS